MTDQYLEFIHSRRSFRQFTEQQPTDDQVENILKAACSAPSSRAIYPCHFIVIKSKDTMAEIRKVHEKAPALETAPLTVIVCGEPELSELAWRDDCAAATMNILYAAHAQGLGACWHGIHPREYRMTPISAILKLPENIIPYSLITIGYPQKNKEPRQRYDENCIHMDGCW